MKHAVPVSLVVLATALGLTTSPIQAQTDQTADTMVDILGLKDWTPARVEAAVQRYVPGMSLASSACAVILRDSVGFDAASVTVYPQTESRPTWVIITLVEPGRAKPLALPPEPEPDTIPTRWLALDSAMNRDWQGASLLQNPAFLLTDTAYAWGRKAPPSALDLRAHIRALRSPEDWASASALIHARDLHTRTLAAEVLSNFPDSTATWPLLLQADVGWDDSGSSMADMVLGSLARSGRYTVDWAGTDTTLVSAFSGWNLFALPTILGALVETHADRARVLAILRRQPDVVLAYLSAKNPYTPRNARFFLTYLAGSDLGPDVSAWKAWLAGE